VQERNSVEGRLHVVFQRQDQIGTYRRKRPAVETSHMFVYRVPIGFVGKGLGPLGSSRLTTVPDDRGGLPWVAILRLSEQPCIAYVSIVDDDQFRAWWQLSDTKPSEPPRIDSLSVGRQKGYDRQSAVGPQPSQAFLLGLRLHHASSPTVMFTH
jgi:hypothetical protein